MNEQMTVLELCKHCMALVKAGYGDRKIVISDDNEGNGYHGLFYGFTEIGEGDEEYYDSLIYDTQEREPKAILLLG